MLEHDVFGNREVIVVKDAWQNSQEMHLDTYFNLLDRDLALLVADRYVRDCNVHRNAKCLKADIWIRNARGGHPIDWNPRGNEETTPRELDTEFTGHLEFDSVGYTNGGFFECSPLSCNDVAKNIAVNRFCLVDDLEQATSIAKNFSMPDSRVEPAWAYVVISVLRRRESQ